MKIQGLLLCNNIILTKPPKSRSSWLRNAQKSTHAVHMDLPLHLKSVEAMLLHEFERILHPIEKVVWDFLSGFLNNPLILASAAAKGKRRTVKPAAWTQDDITRALAGGIIQLADDPSSVLCGSAFSVDELSKNRRRAINHPAQLNDGLDVPILELPDVEEVRKTTVDCTHAWICDGVAWYYQIPLSESVRQFFGFLGPDNRHYVMTRLPMGASFSCAVAHFISATVAARASERGGAKVLAYIDNYVVLGTEEAVLATKVALLSLAKTLNITLEGPEQISTSFDFIGFSFCLDSRRMSNSLATTQKAICESTFPLVPMPCRWFLSVFGRIFGCLRLFPWAIAQAFYLLKWYRWMASVAPSKGLDHQVIIWKCLARKWNYIFALIRRRLTVPIDNIADNFSHIVTADASDIGLGFSIFSASGCRTSGRSFLPYERKMPIHNREAIALYEAVCQLPIEAKPLLCTDNALVFFALRKRYAASYLLNELARHILTIFRDDRTFEVCWIPSQLNPADIPSRQASWDDGSVSSLWEQLFDAFGSAACDGGSNA